MEHRSEMTSVFPDTPAAEFIAYISELRGRLSDAERESATICIHKSVMPDCYMIGLRWKADKK